MPLVDGYSQTNEYKKESKYREIALNATAVQTLSSNTTFIHTFRKYNL